MDDICHPEHRPERCLQAGTSSTCRLQACMSSRMSSARHPQVGTSSACCLQVCISSAGTYVIRTSSAELLMVSVDLNYLSTVTGTGY